MRTILSSLLFLAIAAAPAFADRDLGEIVVAGDKALPVRVSANTPELNSLAQQAFGVHGRYKVVAAGYVWDIRFTQMAPTQVKVDIVKGEGATPLSEVVSGTDARNALLRAADVAVEKTNGLGLHGFFASKLAFIGEATGHKEVYTGDLFFGEVKRITNDRAIALSPRWSPDGQKLIYTSFYHSGFPDIFLIDLATNQRTTFESFRGTNSGAHFSPDGRQVAMVLTGEGTPEIYVSDAQGHRVARRTRIDSTKSSPCWSPDGSRIVFASEPGPQLYVIPSAGGSMQRITHESYCAEPDWSRANPNKIAYTIRVGGRYQIAVFDFSKNQSQQVSKAPFDGIEPSWLPDGRHLVYTARTQYASVVSVLDTETGQSKPISPTHFGPAEQASVWAPR